MTANTTPPHHREDAPAIQHAQESGGSTSEVWGQRFADSLRPVIASIEAQVADVTTEQLDLLRTRVQRQVEQEPAKPTPAVEPHPEPVASPPQRVAEQPEHDPALVRWSDALEDAGLVALVACGILEGIAVLLQMMDNTRSTTNAFSAQEEDGASLFRKFGRAIAAVASSIRQTVSEHVTGGPGLQHMLEGALASSAAWGRILGHASALLGALRKDPSEISGSPPNMRKWSAILKHGPPLVKELKQVFSSLTSGDDESSDVESGGGSGSGLAPALGRASSALQELGSGFTSKRRGGESEDSQSEDDSSSDDEDHHDSPLEKLVGKDSPLQALREFSRRQEGPGGLAPSGPIGRKPPPGPLRRDRLPHATRTSGKAGKKGQDSL